MPGPDFGRWAQVILAALASQENAGQACFIYSLADLGALC
jgi:hypothetical protein